MTNYSPPFFLFNAHLETIFPAVARKVKGVTYERERINTPDDDFLDLDWLRHPTNSLPSQTEQLVIISHGLEGNTSRAYIKGMAKAFYDQGFDALTWNYRGCGEEMNRQQRFYHSGATDDLDTVIQYAINKKLYKAIYLIGFSLGGNITLKYLGERQVNPIIKKAVAFSVPMDLRTSCEKISSPSNWIYSNRFLKSLKKKVTAKASQMPSIDVSNIQLINNLKDFDDRYTAPMHGFRDALHYYHECSSIRFVDRIKTPTLLINAQNDPFLSQECFPVDLLKDHSFVRFENPLHGGHVGFIQLRKNGLYWSEEKR